MPPENYAHAAPVVLYDGDCGMCNRVVNFVLRHERAPTLNFASLDSDYAVRELALLGFPKPPPHTVVVLNGPGLLIRSDAALFIAGHLRAPCRWLRIVRLVPRPVRDAAYDFVAMRRHRWFPNNLDACGLADAATRRRFL